MEEKSGIALTPEEEERRGAEHDATYVKNLERDLDTLNKAGGLGALARKINDIKGPEHEKTGIEVVEKREDKAPIVTSSVGGQEGDEKLLEKKVEELKETARKRAEEVGKLSRQIAECTSRILTSDKQMPDDVKEFFLDRLWPQLEVMSSRNGLFLVRNDGLYFDETMRVATRWLKTIEKAAALAESTDVEGWNKFMVSGMPNAIRGSFMMDDQFWGFPSNGLTDTFGVPTFERIAKEELGKKK